VQAAYRHLLVYYISTRLLTYPYPVNCYCIRILYRIRQCSGSVTFWCGPGSTSPFHLITDQGSGSCSFLQ
jgi:hypothetical protein